MAHCIEQYDSMVSRDQTPWHQLGVVWNGPMTTQEVVDASGLGWEVKERQIMAFPEQEDRWGNCPLENYKVLLRCDQDVVIPLGVVSKKYTVLQNYDIFEAMDPLVQDGVIEYETAGSLRNGKTVWALARFSAMGEREVISGDTVRPYLLITTTHDGTGAVQVQPTPIRVVCNNTLQASLGYGCAMNISHTGNVAERTSMAVDAMCNAQESMESVIDTFSHMAQTELNAKQRDNYFRLVMPDAPENKPRMQQRIDTQRETWEAWTDSAENRTVKAYRPNTMWGAYNAITRMATHCVSSRVQDASAHQIDGGAAALRRNAFNVAVSAMKSPELLIAD